MRLRILIAVVIVLALGVSMPALAGGRPLSADLSWANEVPPATGTSATGTAQFTLNQGQGEVCFQIETTGLSGPVLADHIHVGAAGENGGVVVNLGGAIEGCVDGVDADVIKDIRQNPGNYYLNLHTASNPGGEIRGQLSK